MRLVALFRNCKSLEPVFRKLLFIVQPSCKAPLTCMFLGSYSRHLYRMWTPIWIIWLLQECTNRHIYTNMLIVFQWKSKLYTVRFTNIIFHFPLHQWTFLLVKASNSCFSHHFFIISFWGHVYYLLLTGWFQSAERKLRFLLWGLNFCHPVSKHDGKPLCNTIKFILVHIHFSFHNTNDVFHS